MLNVFYEIPTGFLACPATELHQVLPGPSLIHLPGKIMEPLFVSTLLHGNETTGLMALQKLLKDYGDQSLPRALSIFVGNVAAAKSAHRCLPDQPDYNRIWQEVGGSLEAQMMQQVIDEMKHRQVFASVDIHNNTGRNPHYACINELGPAFYHLARGFSATVVYFRYPPGVQSMAFAKLCPAVTIECGQVGEAFGVEHAAQFLASCLELKEIPSTALNPNTSPLYHTVATLKVSGGVPFGFDEPNRALNFRPDLDQLNFQEIPAGTVIAHWSGKADQALPLLALNESDQDVSDKFLELHDTKISLKRPMMPSMFTQNKEVIAQDCLGYLMEPMDWL